MGLFKKTKNKNDETKNQNVSEIDCDDVLLRALLNNESITEDMALSIPAVASAVEKITNTVACIPFKLYKEEEKDGRKTVAEIEDDRVNLINFDTKDTLDGFQFKKQWVRDYLIGKGGYAYINRRLNKVISLHYVDENKISVFKNTDPIFKAIKFSVDGNFYEPYSFLKIIRATKDGAQGEAIISQIENALQTSLGMLKYQLGLVKTGGNKKGFVKSPKKLSKEAIEALKAAWQELYTNSEQNVVVLNDGLEFQESSNTSLEMQINQSKITLNNEIDKIFGIDNDDEKYFKFAISPIITAIETALNRDLLLETEKDSYFFAADMTEITKLDMKSRFEAYNTALSGKWITRNEIRYKENMDSIDGLDTIDMGLGACIFDTKTGTYFVPNTGEKTDGNKTAQKGGDE